MCIGDNVFKGKSQKAYLSSDKEYRYLTLVLIGPTRAGKSTLIGNLSKDSINYGECTIIFDFVSNCELSNEVSELFPNNKILNIECDKEETLQGLGYNEVRFSEDPFTQYINAKKQASQLKALINSINSGDKVLTSKMERYLTSAALVTFISNGSINDVFKVLQNHKIRKIFINKVPKVQYQYIDEYLEYLTELDEYESKTNKVISTRLHLITGIIDRLNKLKDNPYMELMLNKSTNNNIDLVKEMQKNQVICLKMPEDMFSTDSERDVYCTYWITKIWLTLQIRKSIYKDRSKLTKVNLIIDELYQVEHTEEFLTSKLSRLAKFNMKPIISCHYLNQIKTIRDELRSANASYMLISGCDKKNYDELKEELYPFVQEDVLNLPRYHSLNYIKYKNGYAKFITKLPKPIK